MAPGCDQLAAGHERAVGAARTAKPPPRRAAGLDLAAVERHSLAHPDQAVAAADVAGRRRRGPVAVVLTSSTSSCGS